MSDRHSRALDKLSANLAPLFAEEDFELAKKTLVEACRATRRVRAGKDPKTGSYMYDDVPDYPIRVAAACKIVEWVAGKPVARSITANLTPGANEMTSDEFFSDLFRDEGAVQSIQDTLEKMKTAFRKNDPVDVMTSKPVSSSTCDEQADQDSFDNTAS